MKIGITGKIIFTCSIIALFIFVCIGGLATGIYWAWEVNPAKCVDTTPNDLAKYYQADYLRMSIESFQQDNNCELAKQRYQSLGEDRSELLAEIIIHPGDLYSNTMISFSNCVK
jgi:hypothetical protein